MPSRPMLATPERSDQIPPRPASPIGTARPTAAAIVPVLVKSAVSAKVRANESATRAASNKSPTRMSLVFGSVSVVITYLLHLCQLRPKLYQHSVVEF